MVSSARIIAALAEIDRRRPLQAVAQPIDMASDFQQFGDAACDHRIDGPPTLKERALVR
jgi:hypothetical protein